MYIGYFDIYPTAGMTIVYSPEELPPKAYFMASATQAPLVISGIGGISSVGMTVEQSCAGSGDKAQKFSWVLCDLNGESYRNYEWALARTRAADCFTGDLDLVHPADCWGDIGAATGALLLAYAAEVYANGYTSADAALPWTASESGNRAAVVLGK